MATWINTVKNTANWTNKMMHTLSSFLLKEDTFYLLMENGGRITLTIDTYSNQVKNSSTFSNQAKN